MRKRQRHLFRGCSLSLTFVLVLLAGCAERTPPVEESSRQQAGPPTSEDLLLAAARVALPPAGVTPADLPDPESAGAQHLVRYCTACHALPSPASHSATDWPGVVRRMWLRMDLIDPSYNVPVPNGAERLVLSDYLIANALQVRRAGLPAGAGRDLFVSTCGRCHELPDPSQHSPADWAEVVRRMQGHIETMLGETMSQTDSRRITAYLQSASQ
jgi:cytochrome c5